MLKAQIHTGNSQRPGFHLPQPCPHRRVTLETVLPETDTHQAPALILTRCFISNSSKDTWASQIRNIFISFPKSFMAQSHTNDSILWQVIHSNSALKSRQQVRLKSLSKKRKRFPHSFTLKMFISFPAAGKVMWRIVTGSPFLTWEPAWADTDRHYSPRG